VKLAKYEAAMIRQYNYKASMDYAKKTGKEEGKSEIARNMLGEGLEPALVAFAIFCIVVFHCFSPI
jgi:hypothetical protein